MTHLFRASSLASIMTDPKGKDEILSVGAKSQVERIAMQFVYGFDEKFSSKYTEKGIAVEDKSIELYNTVFFTDYKKNVERKENNWITGECDIATPTKIIDVKSSWSLATFPATSEAGKDKAYEWQLRAYMMLWNLEHAEVAYCLVDTPDELIGYEDVKLHQVEHITPELRLTRILYTRDRTLEDKIKAKCEAANEYLETAIKLIVTDHQFN